MKTILKHVEELMADPTPEAIREAAELVAKIKMLSLDRDWREVKDIGITLTKNPRDRVILILLKSGMYSEVDLAQPPSRREMQIAEEYDLKALQSYGS